MISFIHTGDVHLGMVPDKGMPWSLTRKQEIWDTFRRIIERARQQKTNLLLIAGDLFHKQPSVQELKEVNYLFTTIPETKVVMIAGNHDYLRPFSAHDEFVWAENVSFIKESTVQKLVLAELGVNIYGLSYHRKDVTEGLLEGLKPDGSKNYQVVLAHGGEKGHLPINFSDMGKAGFDYIALGHIHHPMMRNDLNMAYCGSLEPMDVNDKGLHGFVEGELGEGGTKTRFVPFSKRHYQKLEFDVTGMTTLMEIGDELKRRIELQGSDDLYDLVVVGMLDQDVTLTEKFLASYGNVVRVSMEAQRDYDFVRLMEENRDNMLGIFIRNYWKESMTNEEEKALYYGVKALIDSQVNE